MRMMGAEWKGLDEVKKAEKENEKLAKEFGEGPEQDLLLVELAELITKTIKGWKKEVKKRTEECEEEECEGEEEGEG
jgi:hypothetical protein